MNSKISREIGRFSKKETSELFKKVKRISRHPAFDVSCAPATKDFGRILVVTPKRIAKAVKRNLTRRRIKAIFYEEKLYKRLLDCILFVKKDCLELSFEELKQLVIDAVHKSKKSHNSHI